MSTESRYLSFCGVQTHFRVKMPETPIRKRILFLCSPGMSTFHWRKLLPEMEEEDALVVLADFPEFGRSECRYRTDRSWNTQASILWGILDETDRSTGTPMSMWHMIGHGAACRALYTMLRMSPDSVCSQVYISPLLTGVRTDALRHICTDDAEAFRDAAEWLSGYALEDYVLNRAREPLLRIGMQFVLDSVLRTELPRGFAGNFCPTLVVYGERDPLMDARQRRVSEQYLPEAERHILKSAGHYPMETHSRALRDYLRGWFRYLGE